MYSPPLHARWIIDGMGTIQALKPEKTYKDYFYKVLNNAMPKKGYQPSSLEIIMDNYISNSTENGTRGRRGDRSTRIHITGLGQKMPETDDCWHDLLSNSDNKTDLIKLFAEYLKSDEVRKMFNVPVFFTRKEKNLQN